MASADCSDVRLVFVGDSYVAGLGDRSCLGWTGRLAAAAAGRGYRVAYYNLGLLRSSTADLLERLRDEVPRRLPSGVDGRLVLAPGISDLIVGIPLDVSAENARSIGEWAVGRWPAIAVGPPPGVWIDRNDRIRALSIVLERGFRGAGVPYLDVFDPLLASEAWMSGTSGYDGFHPTGGGYAVLARLVAGWPSWRAWFPEVLPEDVEGGDIASS